MWKYWADYTKEGILEALQYHNLLDKPAIKRLDKVFMVVATVEFLVDSEMKQSMESLKKSKDIKGPLTLISLVLDKKPLSVIFVSQNLIEDDDAANGLSKEWVTEFLYFMTHSKSPERENILALRTLN